MSHNHHDCVHAVWYGCHVGVACRPIWCIDMYIYIYIYIYNNNNDNNNNNNSKLIMILLSLYDTSVYD